MKVLADQAGVKFQGASLGTFARKIVKEVVDNIGEINE